MQGRLLHYLPVNDLRFPTALQMVLSLAVAAETGARCTSGELAGGLGANPALVRALLVPLSRAGIIATTSGKMGGVRLARPPEEITLRAVYAAVVDDKRLFAPRPNVPSRCVVSSNISSFFIDLAAEAEEGMVATLGKRTVAHSLAKIREIDALRR